VGAAIGAVCLAISILATGEGHGAYLPARILFPLPVVIAILTRSLCLTLVTAAIQMPIYALAVVFESQRLQWRSFRIVLLLILHSACVVLSFAVGPHEHVP
jgi:hypothetical protein